MDVQHYVIEQNPNIVLFIRQEAWGYMVVRRDLNLVKSTWSRRFSESDEMPFSYEECTCSHFEDGKKVRSVSALDAAIAYMEHRAGFKPSDLPIYAWRAAAKQIVASDKNFGSEQCDLAYDVHYAPPVHVGEKKVPVTIELSPTPLPKKKIDFTVSN